MFSNVVIVYYGEERHRYNQFGYFTKNITFIEGDIAPGQTSLSLVWPVIHLGHSLKMEIRGLGTSGNLQWTHLAFCNFIIS